MKPWAQGKPELLSTLRDHGTRLLVDTFGWRYRFDSTLDVAKMQSASWAPGRVLDPGDAPAGADLVRRSLVAQASLGADAYLVPGWIPTSGSEDLRQAYGRIISVAGDFDDVPGRPLILFVGGHTKGIEHVRRLLDELPHFHLRRVPPDVADRDRQRQPVEAGGNR